MGRHLARTFWDRVRPRRMRRFEAYYEGVLGTSLELQFVADRAAAAAAAETAALDTIARLESVFSVFAPDSELLRWAATSNEDVAVSLELADALEYAEHYRVTTRGAFDPRTEALARTWQARAVGAILSAPDPIRRAGDAGEDLVTPLWKVARKATGLPVARKLTTEPINLNALAKGIIIDRACEAAAATAGVRAALVNIGGDLRHVGDRPITVAVTDPRADAENAPPLATVRIRGEGLATSGGYRRGFSVEGRHRSHILDPRTGEPADDVLSATVIADSAAAADALATAFSVLAPAESVALADSFPGVACLIATAATGLHANERWLARPAE